MAVIVDHGDAARLAGLGETPLHSGKPGERIAHHIVGQAHLGGDGNGGERVLHVVPAVHRQVEGLHAPLGTGHPVGDDGGEL